MLKEGDVISKILTGDALEQLRTLPDESADCVVTSPPYYGLRDYGVAGQIGLEGTPRAYVERLADVFDEVRRVLKPTGTLWLNLGDSYANDSKWGGSTGNKHAKELHGQTSIGRTKRRTGLKPKDRIGIPWRVAFELQDRGWYLRDEVIWAKPNPMPEAVKDRTVKSHETVFLLTKAPKYFFAHQAIQEPAEYDGRKKTSTDGAPKYRANRDALAPGRAINSLHARGGERWQTDADGNFVRNRRSVWWISPSNFPEAHFATMPPALARLCLLAGCPKGGTVLDPFTGSGTTGAVATRLGLDFIGVELNPEYVALAEKRIAEAARTAALKPGLFDELDESEAA